MAVSKKILGIAAVSALLAAAAPEAKAASSIRFLGGSANVDFGAANSADFSVVAQAKCPGANPGTCNAAPGTGIFAGYNAYEALGGNDMYVALNSTNTFFTDTNAFKKNVGFFVGAFNVVGGGAPIAVSPKTGDFFAGIGEVTQINESTFIRNFTGSTPIPVNVTGAFGTRSGTVTITNLAGSFTSATGGETYTFDWYSDITLSVDDPSSSVPGPLPLLGAGAAFGFSRKLRKRISASAS